MPEQISEFFRQYVAYLNENSQKDGKKNAIEDIKYCFEKDTYFNDEGIRIWESAIPELKG